MGIGHAKVISFINLKGGVGKTTSAVNVAATLAGRKFKPSKEAKTTKTANVLLIDLDPQSNASLTLVKKGKYEELDSEKPDNQTLYKLFDHELSRDSVTETFALNQILIPKVHGLDLDLIPSSLKLVDIQDDLVKYHQHYLSTTDILFNALYQLNKINKKPGKKAYTHIIIDCPPSLGLVTLNGLAFSDYYIVPTLLDAYSHWGLNKIVDRVKDLKRRKSSCEVELLGVFYSKLDKGRKENAKWEKEFEEWLSENGFGNGNKVFNQKISNREIMRKAETDSKPLIKYHPDSSDKKYYEESLGEWTNLVDEILERLEQKEPEEIEKVEKPVKTRRETQRRPSAIGRLTK